MAKTKEEKPKRTYKRKNKEEIEVIDEIIDDAVEINKPVKKEEKKEKEKKKEVIEEPFFDNSHHFLQKLAFIVLIILVIGAIGFYYYNNIFSSPLRTFVKSISNYQEEIKYQEDYNKLNAVVNLSLSTNNEIKKAGYDVLTNLSIYLTFMNDKEMSYMEVNTKYKNSTFVNVKSYGNRENEKYITYLKLDKGYEKYLKYETKYLQYFSLIKLIKEEKLNKNIEKILEDTLKKGNFERTITKLDGKKISKNTLTLSNSEYKELMTKIVKEIKNNKDLMKKLSKHYNDPEKILDNLLTKIKNSKSSYEITAYNKFNLSQDLIKIEIINRHTNSKTILTPKKSQLTIDYEKNNKLINIQIDRNSNSGYNVEITINKDKDNITIDTVINLDKTNDVTELKINDDMLINDLNKDTLEKIISQVTNINISNIFKIFVK